MKKILTVSFIILFLLPVFAQENKPLREITLNTAWTPQAQFAGYFVAQEKGFYAKRGIKVNFIYGGFDASVRQNLMNKKADLGIMWLHEGLIAHDKDKDIVNIAQFFHDSNIWVVSRHKKIKSIAIWRPFLPFLTAFIHDNISDSIEIVPARDVVGAFVDGAVDAATVMNYNEYDQLVDSGIDSSDVFIRKFADMGLVLPEDGLYCRKDFYEKNKDLCQDFIQASIEGWNYAFDHVEEGAQICLDYIDSTDYYSNIIMQKLMLSSIKKACGGKINGKKDLKLNEQSFDQVMNFLYKNHIINSKVEYGQFWEGN
jgi:NitT/TauT family transport system substrate-binding protein